MTRVYLPLKAISKMEKIEWHSIQAPPLMFGAEGVENSGMEEYLVILRRVWNLLTMFGNEKRLHLFQVFCYGTPDIRI